jgi:hypothetical protein
MDTVTILKIESKLNDFSKLLSLNIKLILQCAIKMIETTMIMIMPSEKNLFKRQKYNIFKTYFIYGF